MSSGTPLHLRRMTMEEYLAFEEQSEFKHEYVNGHVYPIFGYNAPRGTTERHNLIAGSLYYALRQVCRSPGCRALIGGVKLRVGDGGIYYPDVMVIRDPADHDQLLKTRPFLVAEVMSLATLRTDREEKLRAYLELPSLRYCILAHESDPVIEWYWRGDDGSWNESVIKGDQHMSISELDLELTPACIYEDVKLGEDHREWSN